MYVSVFSQIIERTENILGVGHVLALITPAAIVTPLTLNMHAPLFCSILISVWVNADT